MQILDALRELHSLGYTHSDIKPDNICYRFKEKPEFPLDSPANLKKANEMGLFKTLEFALIDFGCT